MGIYAKDGPSHRIAEIRAGEPLISSEILLLGGYDAILGSQQPNLARIAEQIGQAMGTDNPRNWRICQSRLDSCQHLADWEGGDGVRSALSVALSPGDEQEIDDMAQIERRQLRLKS